jgi:hypothetical protein
VDVFLQPSTFSLNTKKIETKPERQILSAERAGKRGLALQKHDFSFL